MSDYNTAKYLSKQMKARGLQKLKFYCQVCKKQCRDENGFKSHIRSPFHLKNISSVTQKDIDDYSQQFEDNFLLLLKSSHGEKWIEANKFYNEFIQDKDHIHMNATRFTSLNKFIQHLGKTGRIKIKLDEDKGTDVDNIDMGQLQISYIDRSHDNVMRKQQLNELESSQKSEQEIKIMLLQRQIENVKSTMPTTSIIDQTVESNSHLSTITKPEEINMHLSKPQMTKKVTKQKKKKKASSKNVFE
ncbi:hypothetical protein MOUN0_I01398 [Monosporozyma unispora]|nr:hypothetical protein C6P44_002150 [Kazachstania unispora]